MNRDAASPFQQTRWSLIQRAQAGGGDASVAIGELCMAYWMPLYGWARRSGASPEDAEDVVQGFFGDVLRKQLFQKADAAKGRLRTFLLTAFRRYQHDVWAKAHREQRAADRTVSFDALAGEEWYRAEANLAATPDAFYDRQWAVTVLDQAMQRLGSEYAKRGKGADFERLRRYLTAEAADYDTDAAALGVSANAVKVAVHRLRERFRDALRAEVASMQDESENVDEELAHLLRALES